MELKEQLDNDLTKQNVSPSVLLDTLSVINEESRKTSSYVDPKYIPFYYYLGKYISPVNVIEIGTGLAFFTASFLKSCKTVNNLFTFQEQTEEFYSPRFALRNIKSVYRKNIDFHYGAFADNKFNEIISKRTWDLVLFNEEKNYDKHLLSMDSVWEHLNLDGYMVVDYVNSHEPASKAFFNFCKIKNREPILLKTRYGVGIIQK